MNKNQDLSMKNPQLITSKANKGKVLTKDFEQLNQAKENKEHERKQISQNKTSCSQNRC